MKQIYVWCLGLLSDVLWWLSECVQHAYLLVAALYFKGELANVGSPHIPLDAPPPLYMREFVKEGQQPHPPGDGRDGRKRRRRHG